MKLSHGVSGALRTFAFFMANGTHDMLEGVDDLPVYGNDPSAIKQAHAGFANVLEFDEPGTAAGGGRTATVRPPPGAVLVAKTGGSAGCASP